MGNTTPVSLSTLVQFHDRCVLNGVAYGYGSKAKSLTTQSHRIERIDCSGYVRLLLAQSSRQKLIIPDGSVVQRAWCEANWRPVEYTNIPKADDSRLFIAFITPFTRGAGRVGHVWLVGKFDDDQAPDTIESYGGHGVGSRAWNNRTLLRMVHKCFEVPTAHP